MSRNILLCISGGIAAYKTPELVRLWVKLGHQVKVIVTDNAQHYVAVSALEVVCGGVVYTNASHIIDGKITHTYLAKWADIIVIAPATANVIAKLSHGFCDDLLSMTILATNKPIYIAPAMNIQMYGNVATRENLNRLSYRGYHILATNYGEQACGDIGYGRMLEPEEIVQYTSVCSLGYKIVITAGGTQEAIDPVRYISNHSSGKMGYALARAFADCGCDVTLVSAPTAIAPPNGVRVVQVSSAIEMFEAVKMNINDADIFIGAAAVADYRPQECSNHKHKKSDDCDELILRLVKNPDIIAYVSSLQNRPFVVGFAAETDHPIEYARAKIQCKNLDLIVVNQIDASTGYPFNSGYNTAVAIDHNCKEVFDCQHQRKELLAQKVRDYVIDKIKLPI